MVRWFPPIDTSLPAVEGTERSRGPKRLLATALKSCLVALVAVAAAGLVPVASPPVGAAGGGTVDLTGSVPATFTSTAGVESVTVTGAPPSTPLTLVDADTLERLLTTYTDEFGQLVVAFVPTDFLVWDPIDGVLPTTDGATLRPGSYRLVSEGVPGEPFAGPVEVSDPFTVLGVDDVPDPSLYDGQVLPSVPTEVTGGVFPGRSDEEGYGYLEVRDGVKLSVNVRLPDPRLYGPGPYPTVVQYSGYAPSRPGAPSGADAGGVLAGALGFAYVGVNVRGSGCSGGTFEVFNAAQAADGYDVIETVARQPWVKNNRVATMGISYSGITQLQIGATNPPSLAAITPVSVIEDPWYQQWPGGIYNSGFTRNWLASRDDEATGGARWVRDRVAGGDAVCEQNRLIRSQNVPFEEFARSLERRPVDADARRFSELVPEIDVPVYLTGAWQDEQTGAQFAAMLDDFTGVPEGQRTFTMFNGQHNDGFSPLMFSRWFEFLSFYLDEEVPQVNPLVRAGAPLLFEDLFEVPGLTFEADRFIDPDTGSPVGGDYASALGAYQAEPEVRVLFEVGDSPDFPSNPQAPRERFDMQFASWPPPAAQTERLYLGADGTLQDAPDAATGTDRFAHDPDVVDVSYREGGLLGGGQISNSWEPTVDGRGLGYETEPLVDDVVVAGPGHVDLWVRTTGTDVALEVVLSEVYPDADPTDDVPPEEVRVQHGLLRAGYPSLDDARTGGAQVDHLFYGPDYRPMAAGEWRRVQVPLYAVAHPFRAGSRLRLEVNTAGGDAPSWSFESPDYGATTHDVGWGGLRPSSLVLSVLPDEAPYRIPDQFAAQEARPRCDWLRAQPCRDYQGLVNETVSVEEPPPTSTSTSTSTTTSTSTVPTSSTSTTEPSGSTTSPSTTAPPAAPVSPAGSTVTVAPAARPVTGRPTYTG